MSGEQARQAPSRQTVPGGLVQEVADLAYSGLLHGEVLQQELCPYPLPHPMGERPLWAQCPSESTANAWPGKCLCPSHETARTGVP